MSVFKFTNEKDQSLVVMALRFKAKCDEGNANAIRYDFPILAQTFELQAQAARKLADAIENSDVPYPPDL